MLIDLKAIYTLWLREMIRFFRLRSRVIGSLGMPIFFLAFMGMGFNSSFNMPGTGDMDYITFLAPGMIGMTLLFSSMFAGLSVLWDREFGFLKEIMVTPVSRVSIILGRTLGGVTTGLLQGIIIMILAIPIGFEMTGISVEFSIPSFVLGVLLSILFMGLIAATFIGLGLAFASIIE
ncbi:MAG: ABC transporter permease, partial [Halobacteriota archaeon]|nr:ABC transporter permease [Halobacteriota archaeon]